MKVFSSIFYLLSFFLWTVSFSVSGQSSMVSKKARSTETSQSLEDLLHQADSLLNENPNTAYAYVESALEISVKQEDRISEAKCYMLLGRINALLNQYDIAIDNYQKSSKLLKDLGIFSDELSRLMGEAHFGNAEYTMSIHYFNVFLSRSERKLKEVKWSNFGSDSIQNVNEGKKITLESPDKVTDYAFNDGIHKSSEIKKEEDKADYGTSFETEGVKKNKTTTDQYDSNAASKSFYDKHLKMYQTNINDAFRPSMRIDSVMADRILVEQIIYAHSRLGDAYTELEEYELAKENYNTVIAYEQARENSEGEARANLRLGQIFDDEEKIDLAFAYYSNTVSDLENIEELNEASESLAKIYRDEGDFKEELKIRKNSLERNGLVNNTSVLSKENFEIGQMYLEKEEPIRSIKYFKKSLNYAKERKLFDREGDAYKGLAMAYRDMGVPDLALENFESYVSVVDSMYKKRQEEMEANSVLSKSLLSKQKRIDLLEKDKNLTKKTLELLRQKERLKEGSMYRQRLIIYFLVGGLLLVLFTAYWIHMSARQKKIANQLLALRSLRSQMNPHFIFNALNSVNSFISKSDERTANKYLADFSRLMRAVMENSQHDFVPLSSEIDILRLYLSLEHFRFKDKYNYRFEIDENIDVDDYEIPPMLIQPYIENSIWHGLRYKETMGMLNVSFLMNDDKLTVVIEDDGIGRKKSQEIKTNNQKTSRSTGLKNTRNRLKILNEMYHTDFRVEISDVYEDKEDTGTLVTIEIPRRKENKDI